MPVSASRLPRLTIVMSLADGIGLNEIRRLGDIAQGNGRGRAVGIGCAGATLLARLPTGALLISAKMA